MKKQYCRLKTVTAYFILTLLILQLILSQSVLSQAESTQVMPGDYKCKITVDNAEKSEQGFFARETIDLYSAIVVSGGTIELDAGSYTLIKIPQEYFRKPEQKDISTGYSDIDHVEILKQGDEYQIKTVFKRLVAGKIASMPFRIFFNDSSVANNHIYEVKQEFYRNDGTLLANDSINIKARARIENMQNWDYLFPGNAKDFTDINGIVHNKTFNMLPLWYGAPYPWTNDSRGRRIYAKIPSYTKLVDTNWTYDQVKGEYYKDFPPKTALESSEIFVTLDLEGVDTKVHKDIRVDYRLCIIEDGEIKNDIPPVNAYAKYKFLFANDNPGPGSNYPNWFDGTYQDKSYLIDKNYKKTGYDHDRGNLHSLPYDKDKITNTKLRVQCNLGKLTFIKGSTELVKSDPQKLAVKYMEVYSLQKYLVASEARISLIGVDDNYAGILKQRLKGTKLYGIKKDDFGSCSENEKKLLIDDVFTASYDNHEASFDAEAWKKITDADVGEYKKFVFVFPGEGLVFNGKTEANELITRVKAEVAFNLKEKIYTDIEAKINKNEKPEVDTGIDYAAIQRARYNVTFHEYDDKPAVTTSKYNQLVLQERFMIPSMTLGEYKTFSLQNHNSDSYYIENIVDVENCISFNRVGTINDMPLNNLNLYYLVPEGLEPENNEKLYKEIKVIRNYKNIDGKVYNLVIAKFNEGKIKLPLNNAEFFEQNYNYVQMKFKIQEWCRHGRHKLYSSVLIDNNKQNFIEGNPVGIIQLEKPRNPWSTIVSDGDNTPETPDKITMFDPIEINVLPPKVFTGITTVKLKEEADGAYAHTTGKKITKSGADSCEIDYRWELQNNSVVDIEKFTAINILPYKDDKSVAPNKDGVYSPRNSKFMTPLISIENNEKFDIYVSTDEPKATIEENYAATWTKPEDVTDISKVRMIKAVLKPGEIIARGEMQYIVTHNRVDDINRINDGDLACDSFAFSLTEGLASGNAVEAHGAKVYIFTPERDVDIEKVDKYDHNLKLPNAVFSLYNKENELIADNIETNSKGRAVLKKLKVGGEYYLKETKAPLHYKPLNNEIHFKVLENKVLINGEEEELIRIENQRYNVKMPESGKNDRFYLFIIGIMLIFIGVAMLARSRLRDIYR